jgi:hypothetical protein
MSASTLSFGVTPDSQTAPAGVNTGWYTVQLLGVQLPGTPLVAPAGGYAFTLAESAGTANGSFSPGTTVTIPEGQSYVRFKYQAPTTGARTITTTAPAGQNFSPSTFDVLAVITGAIVAASGATLGHYVPKDAELSGQAVSVGKHNGAPVLKFPKQDPGLNNPIPFCLFDGILLRPAATGFSSTTGVQVKVGWSAPRQDLSGAARFAVAVDLKGQTDLPSGVSDGMPAYGASNEIAGTSNVNASVAGGMNYLSISVPLSAIQNGQTTAPAVGDYFRLRLRRCTESTADTIPHEVYVHSVELVDY